MVYESDFYTTRRPYRSTPVYSSYTVSQPLSRQVRILPGLGKVHVVHTYDRIVPYIGHKRLTVVTLPPKVYSTRSSVLQKEYDWIENKIRPWVAYSPTNRYLNSDSSLRYVYIQNPISGLKYYTQYDPSRYYNFYRITHPRVTYDDDYWPYYYPYYYKYWPRSSTLNYLDDLDSVSKALKVSRIFDDETRLIRAQTASLLKQIHLPVPRHRSWPITPLNRYGDYSSMPAKYSNDTYIHRLLTVAPNSKISYATYYTEPVKKYIGKGHLSCVSYAGAKGYSRRQPLPIYEDAIKNDIQLLSYYINKFREEKGQPKEIQAPLSATRPSRIFSVHKVIEDPVVQEIKDLREARAVRLAKIYESDDKPATNVETTLKTKQKEVEARLAKENAIAEEKAKQEAQAKKEEAARKTELLRQERLAAQAAAERAAELEKQAENARQKELAKQVELEKVRKEEEERARQEKEEQLNQEEERLRQEEEERLRQEKEKLRQEEEERLHQEEERLRKENEENLYQEEQRRLEQKAKAEEERQQMLRLEEIARQAEEEKERELVRQAEELAELARQEAELERKEQDQETELTEIANQELKPTELERQDKELAEIVEDETASFEKYGAELETVTQESDEVNYGNLEPSWENKDQLLASQESTLNEETETHGEEVSSNVYDDPETEVATNEKEVPEHTEE